MGQKKWKHVFNLKNKSLETVLQKAMSKEKRLRYSSAEKFICALELGSK